MSKLIVSQNIKFDRNYTNVLTFEDVNEVLSIMRNIDNIVTESDQFNIIKTEKNTLNVSVSYDILSVSNYIAFQNPDYSNMWFFAFVDSVEWLSPSTSKIRYTIDVHTTYFLQWNANKCFVEREHVYDDSIGLNTVPEGIETGEYIINSVENDNILTYQKVIVMATTIDPSVDSSGNLVGGTNGGGIYGNVKNGYAYYTFEPTKTTINTVLKAFEKAGKSDAIGAIFMLPRILVVGDLTIDIDNYLVPNFYEPANIGYDARKEYGLDGYVPKNNKLKCYPYTFMEVTNNNGVSAVMHYEDFSTDVCGFTINSVPTPGGSTVMTPNNYKGLVDNYDEIITGPKFPICGYQTDAYINWLTQNSINNAVSVGTSAMQLGAGITMSAMGLPGGPMIQSGSMGIIGTMGSIVQHSIVPPQASGNTNSGDVMFSLNKNCYTFYHKSIKYEYASMIDNFFSRFGYKVNTIKYPNMTTRKEFNYVKIGSGECVGYGWLPADAMEQINEIYRRGVTLWHHYDNFLNFDIDNPNI